MTMSNFKCECCWREQPLVGVASTMMPMSIAWCEECLTNNAQPKWIIETSILQCHGRQHMSVGWDEGMTYFNETDGTYHPASEIDVTPEEIVKFWQQYEEACRDTRQ